VTNPARAAFAEQAEACDALGSALTARVLRLLCSELQPGGAVADRVLTWPGDPSFRAGSVALRLAGGLHALVLSGEDADLAEAYRNPPDDAALSAVLRRVLIQHERHLLHWLDNAPQTNEVRRSAVVIAAAHWLTARCGMPLVVSELGTSAGLNLIWDRYALALGGRHFGPPDAALTLTPDWQGALPPVAPPQVTARAGVDLNPLDAETDRLRLLSYVWADQADRLARTAQACAEAARLRPQIDRADAVEWLAIRLATRYTGHLHLIFHTVAWQYFPTATQERGEGLLAEAGAAATSNAPLARLSMETDGTAPGAALILQLWPGNHRLPLGRADFHGRWVQWAAPPVQGAG